MMRILTDDQSVNFIKENFGKGDILRWESFKGKKEIKDRFFILLTSCLEGEFLAVTATSQVQLYLSDGNRRYNKDTVFIGLGECEQFTKDTILDFNWLEYFTINELAKLYGQGMTRTGKLDARIVDKINHCVRNSILISPIDQKKILGL